MEILSFVQIEFVPSKAVTIARFSLPTSSVHTGMKRVSRQFRERAHVQTGKVYGSAKTAEKLRN